MYCITRHSIAHGTMEALSKDGVNWTLHADKASVLTDLDIASAEANRFDRAVVTHSDRALGILSCKLEYES